VPPLTITLVLSDSRSLPPSAKVPALIVVVPMYVLAPESVNVPDPDLVKLPLPEMTPEMTPAVESTPASAMFRL